MNRVSKADELRSDFLSPGDAYSPLPFWFWNDQLTENEILRQIQDFYAHGVAGFVIHPRKGLPRTIPYLSDRYMRFVLTAVKEAHRLGMRVVLYDEAMYPSGSAHGLVVKENARWASRALTMEIAWTDVTEIEGLIAVCAARITGKCASDIEALSPCRGVYRRPDDARALLCFRECFSGGTIRGVHDGEDDGEPLAPASADLLNPDAVCAFIRLTYERYYAVLKEYFGSTVIAMFTDEPDIVGRNARPGCVAWTTGFLSEFGEKRDLLALFVDVGRETEAIRLRYRRAINRRLGNTYYKQLADWCQAHHIALSGHPARSWDIGLLRHFQIPGQDVVWRHVAPGSGIEGAESVLAKCASDAARHSGRRRNANECFGCCGPDGLQWAFSVDDMKWYMDYLFVRGTNLLYPHAFFYSIRDGRGNERAPDVGPNNLWWPMYEQIAAYIRRMCWLMTDSVNQARVAVLCEADSMPWESCKALYENQIEFNYLELDRLAECALSDGALCMGGQRYTHVIVDQADIASLPRDAVITPGARDLRVSHVVKEGVDFYLFVNEGERDIRGRLSVPVSGGAQWWNAWTGDIRDASVDSHGCYSLSLPRRESVILCIDSSSDSANSETRMEERLGKPRVFSEAVWHLTRADTGEEAEIAASADGSMPGWEWIWPTYSGWVVYEADMVLSGETQINLGRASSLVRMHCNDVKIAEKYWAPYVFRLPAGKNHLTIEVCNTLANRLEDTPLRSGIMGPIELREILHSKEPRL